MMKATEEQALIDKARETARRVAESLHRDQADLSTAELAEGRALAAGAEAAARRVLDELKQPQVEGNS
jgi:glutamate racemase